MEVLMESQGVQFQQKGGYELFLEKPIIYQFYFWFPIRMNSCIVELIKFQKYLWTNILVDWCLCYFSCFDFVLLKDILFGSPEKRPDNTEENQFTIYGTVWFVRYSIGKFSVTYWSRSNHFISFFLKSLFRGSVNPTSMTSVTSHPVKLYFV